MNRFTLLTESRISPLCCQTKNNIEALHPCNTSPHVAQTYSAVAEISPFVSENILGGSFVFCSQTLVWPILKQLSLRKRKIKEKKGKEKKRERKEKKKRRKIETASPSGEWQAAHHFGAHSQHSQNKGRRGESCGLDRHCFHPPEGSPGSWGDAAPPWAASLEGAAFSSISINGELEEAALQLLCSQLRVAAGLRWRFG